MIDPVPPLDRPFRPLAPTGQEPLGLPVQAPLGLTAHEALGLPAYAEVMIDSIALADPRPFTYRIPEAWRGRLSPGTPVLVPFGPKRGVAGYVTALCHEVAGDHTAREIEDVIAGNAILPGLQALLAWISDHYLAPMSAVMTTAMPRGTLARVERTLHLAVSLDAFSRMAASWSGPMAVLAGLLIAHGGEISVTRLQTAAKKSGAVLSQWRRLGLVRYHARFKPPDRHEKRQLHAEVVGGAPREGLSDRHLAILEHLVRHGGSLPASTLARALGTGTGTLRTIERRGALVLVERAVRRSAVGHASGEGLPTLTPHQGTVLDTIAALEGQPTTFLLHGVTGSGKTEVYLRAIARVLDREFGAIVLVPEISLTPQTVRRFQARFGDTVAVLHSHMGEGERFDEWQRIRAGTARVVVGARSAIFAPVERLGLVIIDEEHETSYKQDKAPRYHARTVAEKRCAIEGASLILGSATPSLESYAKAQDGRYTLLEMPDRVNARPLPPVRVVDMRDELLAGNRKLFSRHLQASLDGALARGEQAILLLNRRGYSQFVFCRSCGHVCKCTRCAVAMTFHQEPAGLRCHYCDAHAGVPDTCPACQSVYIRHFGAGTRQIEEATRRLYPDARILRVDRDTTSRKGSHQTLLDAFGRGEADILIGTQMVAKGLDFPRVTVVGVMAADGALHLPDFRASEHTFQLLTQVAGRAGRGELASDVVIQTYSPQHPAILAAQRHDFKAFYAYEIREREDAIYPPFIHLVNAVTASAVEADARRAASLLAEGLLAHPELQVFGPIEAPLAMLRGLYRFMVLVKVADLDTARFALRHALGPAQLPGVRIAVDLDPHSLL